LNVPEIALPFGEIDLTFPAFTCWMKLRYEIWTGDEPAPQAVSVSVTSADAESGAKRVRASPEDLL
jgi:hypothetical protein